MKLLPRLLVLDDLFGRVVAGGRNADRENLCANFLWQDATGDESAKGSSQKVLKPVAEAMFCRAQTPSSAQVGDTVENDLQASLDAVRAGWFQSTVPQRAPWAMLLLDLCFYTGRVTPESHQQTPGMPEGRPKDDDPGSYFGLTLLDAIHREFPELPIFILSSKPRDEVSLEFSRRGALGFIARDDLRGPELLQEALWQHGLLPDADGLVVGHSLPLLLALREARRAARHGQNVLIRGERGTGKELLANYLHRVSTEGQKARPFMAVNSPVLTPQLFASELYGIAERTATGVAAKRGLVEMAHGGDVFLDEIADMVPEVQASLLRVIQERQFTKVGGRKPIKVDVRFLSATNADIEDEDNGFRRDLLDRLSNGGTIHLPPLREREADIPLLVERLVREAEGHCPGTLHRTVTAEAMEQLCAHDWPGNVRELRTVILGAVNRQPDVEHLVPGHLRLGVNGKSGSSSRGNRLVARPPEPATPAGVLDCDVALLLEQMGEISFATADVRQWAGRLGEVQRSQQQLIARMVQAALDATKRRTPENPQGILQIHPAMKLLTGDTLLTASKAADVLKRLLGPLAGTSEGDLKDAYDTAVRLRPKTGKAAVVS